VRVVVAGGTGFIGREVVRRLAAGGHHQVVVASRNPRRPAGEAGDHVELALAFSGDHLSMSRAFARADAVVYAVQFPGHPVEQPARGWTYLDVDGRGTPVAVEAARRAGVRRFLYVSGVGAGRKRHEPWFRAKDMAEEAIRASGLEYVILRPSWVYGPGDRSLSRIIGFCRRLPFVPVIGNGTVPMWPLHVDDLAAAAAVALVDPEARELVLEAGGPDRLTMNGVVHAIQAALGRRRPVIHQPVRLMRLAARVMALSPNPILSPGAVAFLTQSVEMDPEPAMRRLGMRFRRLQDALPTLLHGIDAMLGWR
jgi:uncharacterized protein YbjT (DUF2867 family)